MRKRYSVAVVGATGAVGTEMLRVLAQRRFPVSGIRLLASSRSEGRRLTYNGGRVRVETLRPRSFSGIDVALFSAGAARSLEFAPEAVRRGAVVVDNSSAFRMADDVPLIVPEVNPQALRGHDGLIANPNCSTIILLLALAPLHRAAGLTRLIVSTYQSVSGAGARAMHQLWKETRAVVSQREGSRLKMRRCAGPLPAQIAFNVIPHIDAFQAGGSTKEELKMVRETRKILDEPDLPVSATCVRVPVLVGHAEAVWIETRRPLSVEQARARLRRTRGVRLVDVPARGRYPLPIEAAGQDNVLVGRIRKDDSSRRGLALWVAGDNLRKGAATNAVQIAELLIARSH